VRVFVVVLVALVVVLAVLTELCLLQAATLRRKSERPYLPRTRRRRAAERSGGAVATWAPSRRAPPAIPRAPRVRRAGARPGGRRRPG
jgi:hypothetical protein